MNNDLVFYNQMEIANALKISPKTLEAMRQKGNGPIYRKFGRRVLYAESDIKAYLAENAYRSTSEYR